MHRTSVFNLPISAPQARTLENGEGASDLKARSVRHDWQKTGFFRRLISGKGGVPLQKPSVASCGRAALCVPKVKPTFVFHPQHERKAARPGKRWKGQQHAPEKGNAPRPRFQSAFSAPQSRTVENGEGQSPSKEIGAHHHLFPPFAQTFGKG